MIALRRFVLAGFTLHLCAAPAAAQQAGRSADGDLPASFREPMALYAVGLGRYTRPVTTTSAEAQAYFDQGVQLLYSFTPEDAARSFREAQKRDPSCALCSFGEAWAWGPYLNGPMSAENGPRAYAAMQAALRLRERASDVERALIDAMAVRYEPTHDASRRASLDSAYATAMARVYERHPTDLDVGTLYAESLMLLEPRRGNWDVTRPEVQRIHQVLDEVLTRDLHHPGACHLYIHATESTVRPEKAEACAEHLGQAIPGASHINHMPSHTFNRIGRWGDAVRANIEAWHSDLKAEVGEGFAIYPSHNLHMLLFSASYDGQGAIAIQAAKDYAKITRGGSFYQALTLVRFGRFDEVLELDALPEDPIFRGLWDFSRGLAHLRLGRADSARHALARVDSAAAGTPAERTFRGHTAASLLGIVGGILRAELLVHDGGAADAVPVLEHAVSLEDGLRYDEPEPLVFSARHYLGALLLELNRPAEAERVYRSELEKHPRNGWSLLGLAQALRAQGLDADAQQAQSMFADAWTRADTWIRASRF
jgi:tetratricopeptide (TPR) repeat protein